ncbi:hypothetical protein J2W47_004959 [Priestia megaterium]|nr:hypothetical protein [Priestia megaterium]
MNTNKALNTKYNPVVKVKKTHIHCFIILMLFLVTA